MIRLVLGGDKSGKSAHALGLFMADPGPHLLLATGQARDFSFRQQILDHRTARQPEIPVRETGAHLLDALEKEADSARALLVDSLDFWLFACSQHPTGTEVPIARLVEVLALLSSRVTITLVSCEAGLGAIPASAEVRRFVRQLGALNQAVAAVSDEVCLMVAGLPLYLKRS